MPTLSSPPPDPDSVGVDAVDALLGRWELVARRSAARNQGRRAARDRDVGMRVRFRLDDRTRPGLVELEVGRHSFVYGVWRASRAGSFLGSTGDYSDAELAESTPRRGWLDEAVSFSVDAGVLTFRDRAEQTTARLERLEQDHPPASGGGRLERAAPWPAGLLPVKGHQLVGAWQPVHHPVDALRCTNGRRRARFQNVEFTADGWWIPSPRINIGSGRWLVGVDGELLTVLPEMGRTQKGLEGWVELDDWLLSTARAGFDGELVVLLDEVDEERQRLRRLDSRVGAVYP